MKVVISYTLSINIHLNLYIKGVLLMCIFIITWLISGENTGIHGSVLEKIT